MATDHGVKVSDTDHWLAALNDSDSNPGSALLEDQSPEKRLRDSTTSVVYARGTGAHGTVQGSKGSADTVRDVQGFAMKMYTPEGNWDIVGNIPPEPQNEVLPAQTAHNNFWDFVGLRPEAAQWTMPDRAIPRSFRMMQGFEVNTFTLINANSAFTGCSGDEALKLPGQDPDFHRKDLEEAIKSGCPPKWTFASSSGHCRERSLSSYIGEFGLNKCADEFFPETEQAAFCTSHVFPGIGFSDDPLLQDRNFSYFDTQISRLGVNWEHTLLRIDIC
ncbi:catalase [Ephemerocybe angulata]|uniref:catalase n=1 Tax=Ephemerocybe angulata TaxID=980116 RepID=A0A8H6HQB7_9AGAR|nr:catalase [Tulosesus angulatus]